MSPTTAHQVSPPGSPDKAQLLGVAFAAADLAFEVTGSGQLAFVVGAAPQILGVSELGLTGRDWREIVDAGSADVFELILEDLKPGERRGRIPITLRTNGSRSGMAGEVALLRLPGRSGGVSCAFRRGGDAPAPEGLGALLDQAAFEAAAEAALREAAASDLALQLELLETPGFEAALRDMTRHEAAKARTRLSAALRAGAYGGYAAREVGPDRYAVVSTQDSQSLLDRAGTITGATVTHASAPLAVAGGPGQNLRAIRVAMDRHLHGGASEALDGFRETLGETLRLASEFRSAVSEDRIQMVFQPVVSLADRTLHHFEALARFGDGQSPSAIIELAEQLDLIAAFDLAMFRRTLETLQTLKSVRVAVNLSGRSLMKPGFVEDLVELSARWPALRPRLLIEVTETHRLEDLGQANQRIAQLRQVGHLVCLDDFGAGAASLDYLQRLTVDMVKLDGRYVRDVAAQPRDAAIVEHVVRLCHALGLTVIGEMIENTSGARAAKRLGVDLGQGWEFGRPQTDLVWPPKA